MDALNYVLGGVGLVVLLGAAYLYYLYTKAQLQLDTAEQAVARLKSDLLVKEAESAAKTATIEKLKAGAVADYRAASKKAEESLDKDPADVVLSKFSDLFEVD